MPLFASYALGCGALFLPLSLAVCYSKVFIIERVRGLAEHMPRITASVLIAAGLYMALIALLKGGWS
jgi:hypothetical protein